MDVSTSLVQAYLHVNGYFTATDYPLVEAGHEHSSRMLTDIDMLAVRLNHSEQGNKSTRVKGPVMNQVDPILACPEKLTDMIVAEIKQGKAHVNQGSRNKQVLAAGLARFGCCAISEAPSLVQKLLQKGHAQGENGHMIRMVLFASQGEQAPHGWHWVHLDHVFLHLNDYLNKERELLGSVDLHDPALSWISLLHKCGLNLNKKGKKS